MHTMRVCLLWTNNKGNAKLPIWNTYTMMMYHMTQNTLECKNCIQKLSESPPPPPEKKKKKTKQDHCRGMYLPPSITGEEIPFARYSQFFIFH